MLKNAFLRKITQFYGSFFVYELIKYLILTFCFLNLLSNE
ncbi:hypothetical protein QF024_001331 [Chryseobacterium nepalense]|jgi:hypothetical protein|nr:hypothetical protein [Chryseobacterium nepalense]